jgi:hypothetical protein
MMALLLPYLKSWRVICGVAAAASLALLWGIWVHRGHEVAKAKQEAAAARSSAVVAQGQSTAQDRAAQITDQGRAKADVTVHIQQENASVLAQAPGSAQGVDPILYSDLVRGLCLYQSTSGDAACSGLRGANPPVISPANPGSLHSG